MTKLLTLGILFSTAVRATVVAKLVILGTFEINSGKFRYTSFLTTLLCTTSFSLLKSTAAGTNLSTANLSTIQGA